MLRDDIARFTELTGEDGEHTSIQRIGAYLDGYDEGYEQGKKDCGRPKGEWVDFDLKPAPNGVPVEKCGNCGEWSTQMGKNFCPWCGADMDMRGDKE